MDFIYFALSLSVFLLSLALFSNRVRARQELQFDLTPNCLLTRWPLLFVTGPRSIFYFSKYWNVYTSYLAEHGYEVFTLHMPWTKASERLARLQFFLKQQEEKKAGFHIVLDSYTKNELEEFLRANPSSVIRSINEIHDGDAFELNKSPLSLRALPVPYGHVECLPAQRAGLFFELSYNLHRRFLKTKNLPSLSTLGGSRKTQLGNCSLLLERARTLAEMDLRDP